MMASHSLTRYASTVVFAFFGLCAMSFVGGAFRFFKQEQLTRANAEIETPSVLYHPEATLRLVQSAFDSNNYAPDILESIALSIDQVPAFYQPPFLLAHYHETRIEEPLLTRRAYEAALKRYPSNGRLHLAFAQWLWESKARFPTPEQSGETGQRSESHLKKALLLEPDLTGPGLALLSRARVPPRRWASVVPEGSSSRQQVFQVLARAGHREIALELLRTMLEQDPEPVLYGLAAQWALRWGDPELAIESARLWQGNAMAGTSLTEIGQSTLMLARSHLERGENETALQVFRKGLKEIEARSAASDPAALELLCDMATVYLNAGQTVMAESLFAEAFTLAPHHAASAFGLARTYRRSGDLERAIEHYQKALQLEPANTQAEKELAELILQRELTGTRR